MFFRTAAALSVLTLATAQTSLDIALIEAHFSNSGIVPSLLATFDPSATINASFSGVGITPGQALSKDQVASAPTLAITPANSSVTFSGKYTVVMADADIVGTDESVGQTRHWLVNSATVSNGQVSTGDGATAITNYAGPGPAAGSGAHRYVILVLPQPDDFSPPSNLSTANTPLGVFQLTDYISSSKLGQPIAGTYFTVEEGTASVSASATSAVNTQSISAALAKASSTGSAAASGSASGSAAASSSTPTGNSASAVQLVSGPLAFVATLFGLVML
ncbi:PEBP-like protein [Peniophora sp. CONT]|nr:PEBP-like protein [Peniophora sp. CONT]